MGFLNSHTAALFGMIIALSTTGCASLGLFQTPQERVQSRSQDRLDTIMRGEFKAAYAYLTPAFRETSTWQRYASRYAGVGSWRGATVKSVDCEPERCNVKVSIRYQMVRLKIENTRSFDEVWIEVGGKWYIYHE
jgi:hypothetical protein